MRPTVKDLLVETKDAAELMVDLAYAAVFFDDAALAREVIRLEERMDEAIHELRVGAMLAVRAPADAERMAGILGLANAIEEVGDAAEDIARVVLTDLGVPPELRDDLRHAEEVTARVKLREDSVLATRSLADLALPTDTGMWVIAIRRDVDFVFGPDGGEVLTVGDVLLVQGPADGVDLLRAMAGAEPYRLAPPVEGRLSHLDRAVDLLVEMKNAAEVAVGLAYSAILLDDRGLAGEVARAESRCDALYSSLLRWTLRAAADLDPADVDELRGVLQIGQASERIADAAQEMTRIVERDDPTHPVLAAALAAADEIVADAVVAEGSDAVGRSLAELSVQTATGMHVLAIERGQVWRYRPRGTERLDAGDRLVSTGPEEGVARLRGLVGDGRPHLPD